MKEDEKATPLEMFALVMVVIIFWLGVARLAGFL